MENFTHYDQNTGMVDFASVMRTAESAPDRSIFILQGCCHNPTGLDYSKDQWKELADLMLEKKHFAFFDVAYQGFGSSMSDAGADDVWAVRHFVEKGVDMLACQSFSKNMGLYSERVGALHIVCRDSSIAENVKDTLRSLIRWEVSSTPAYGARLAEIILTDKGLYDEWCKELSLASDRLVQNRNRLHHILKEELQTPGSWDHLKREKGLFAYTHLTEGQIADLAAKHHVYLPGNGRLNVAGMNDRNMENLAAALDAVVRDSE